MPNAHERCGMQDNSLPFSGYWAQGGHGALPATSQAAGMAVESTAGRERLHESVGSAAGGIAGDCDRKRTRDLWEVRGGEGQSWTGGGYARGNGAAGGGHGRGSNLTASQEEFISGDAVRGAGLMPPMSGSTHAPPAAVVERQVDVIRHPTHTSVRFWLKTVFLAAQEVVRTMVQQRRVDAPAHLLCCWDHFGLSRGSSAEWCLFCWFPAGLVAKIG